MSLHFRVHISLVGIDLICKQGIGCLFPGTQGGAIHITGIDAMRRAQTKAKKKLPSRLTFGFRNLKGKGATDLWLAEEWIERIRALCGHKDKATTDVYVKSRWRQSVVPNSLKIGV